MPTFYSSSFPFLSHQYREANQKSTFGHWDKSVLKMANHGGTEGGKVKDKTAQNIFFNGLLGAKGPGCDLGLTTVSAEKWSQLFQIKRATKIFRRKMDRDRRQC